MSPAPGVTSAQTPQPGANGLPFQPPAGLPNINFNAPVIRLGMSNTSTTSKPSSFGYEDRRSSNLDSVNRNRAGLGSDARGGDFGRQQRDVTLQPPTVEEVAKTTYVGGLVKGMPDDETLERILAVGGGLRHWQRVYDAEGEACTFGFAEYMDSIGIAVAAEVFGEPVEVPLKEKGHVVKDEEGNVKKAEIMVRKGVRSVHESSANESPQVHVDPKSFEYIENWTKNSKDELQFKVDNARDDLASLLKSLEANTNGTTDLNGDGDVAMENGAGPGDDAEFVNIPMAAEDELSDIPAELREVVASEIAAFRDRSIKRDLERLRQEEEAEAERTRNGGRINRLASPPMPTPSAAPAGANGVPVASRDRSIQGAPLGPKGYRGLQIPKDYVDGVAFTNDVEADEDDSASDSEIERRRTSKRKEALEQKFLEQERDWLHKEKVHFKAVERQVKEEEAAASASARRRDEMALRLKNFDDESELRKPTHLFYKDRRAWNARRYDIRDKERRADALDRDNEYRQKQDERRRIRAAEGMADDFLAQQAHEIEARGGHKRHPEQTKSDEPAYSLKLGSFGGSSHRGPIDAVIGSLPSYENGDRESQRERERDDEDRNSDQPGFIDVGGLLDDEEDAAAAASAEGRTLKPPAELKPLAPGQRMTDEERINATRHLAASIPNDKAGLWSWPVQWSSLPPGMVTNQLRPYVQKKIMELLGVQEELLVEMVEEVVNRHGTPDEIVAALEDTLDDEAEGLARRVWRMVVFACESEARGLGEHGG